MRRHLSCRNTAGRLPADFHSFGEAVYSAASAFFDLRGAFAALAAARFFGFAGAAAFALAAGARAAFFAAGRALSPRAGRFLRAVEPPPERAARSSISAAASSSVMVSGVLSPGRLALTPSWLT